MSNRQPILKAAGKRQRPGGMTFWEEWKWESSFLVFVAGFARTSYDNISMYIIYIYIIAYQYISIKFNNVDNDCFSVHHSNPGSRKQSESYTCRA